MPVLICLTSTIPGLRCCETLQSAGSGQGGHLQAPKDILKGFMKHKTFTWIWYLGLGREQKPGTRCSLQTAAGPRINSTISIALRFSSIENYDPSFCNTPLLLKWKQNRKWRFVFIFFFRRRWKRGFSSLQLLIPSKQAKKSPGDKDGLMA